METRAGRLSRVLTSLEDLTSQEDLLLRAEDYAALPPLQARMAPLVDCLVADAEAADGQLRERISAVIVRRSLTEETLAQRIVQTGEDLRKIQASRQRIAQVAPAYRQTGEVSPQALLRGRG